MNLQNRNLRIQMQGDDVKLLQEELQLLGYQIPDEEISQSYFGNGTEEAVLGFQQQYNLEETGVVDEETARLINEAVDDELEQFVVRGLVQTDSGEPLAGLSVRAFDKDLRREELLGEAVSDEQGFYEIPYTADQFTRAEKIRADLILRAYRQQNVVLTVPESGALYNAPREANVNLTIEAPDDRELSEYERLNDELHEFLVPASLQPWELNEDDLVHLEHEFEGHNLVTPERLRLFSQDAQLAQGTGLPMAFFYGVARVRALELPLTLDAFLALETAELLADTQQAIEREIIPMALADDLDRIIALLDRLRLEQGQWVRRVFEGRLIKAGTDEPVTGIPVRAVHQREDEERDLGLVMSGRQGQFAYTYLAPRDANDLGVLRLEVLNEEREALYETEVELNQGQDEAVTVEIPEDVLPQPPVKELRQLREELDLQVPDDLLDLLEEREITSLRDVRMVGGLERLDDLPDEVDPETITLLNSHASLDIISSDSSVNAGLIDRGYRSPLVIANTPLATFVADIGEVTSEADAVRLRAAAHAEVKILDNIGLQMRKIVLTGSDHLTDVVERVREFGLTAAQEKCDCEDCDAAVSPRAYLVDLLKYALNNVRTRSIFDPGGDPIDPAFLTSTLHQPIGDLLDDCAATEKKFRQVRLCVEVLRAELGDRPLSDSDLETTLRQDEKQYRLAAYKSLLTKLGSSFQEVRAATKWGQDERQRLAARLGIYLTPEHPTLPSLDHLDRLYLDPGIDPADRGAVSEAALEHLFGLVDTNRDVLSNVTKIGSEDQLRRIELDGLAWRKNTDVEGVIYATLNRSGGQTQLSLYKDETRSKLVAAGAIGPQEGEIQLTERNQSGLSGRIFVSYTADSSVELSAIPRFQSWRMQRLRDLWQTLDWPSDAYYEQRLPAIDPDLIGPDDFRHPQAGDVAFDLWQSRREWVDTQLEGLDADRFKREEAGLDGTTIRVPDFELLLEHMYTDSVSYGGRDHGIAWNPATPRDRFTALRHILTEGTKEDIEAVTNELGENLKLTVESFYRLLEIRDKDQHARQDTRTERVSWDEWHELYSILVQAQKRHLTRVWIEEESRRTIVFGSKSFWLAIQEPVVDEWHSGLEANRPLVDPELVGIKDLPDPTAGQTARTLWHSRRVELNNARTELQRLREGAATATAGFDAILQFAFGSVVDLTALNSDLNSSDETVAAAAEARIRDELYLTVESFRRLVTLKQKNDEGTAPLSPTEWSEGYTILTGAYKWRARYPVWISDERDLALAYWQALKARLPKWRASSEGRQAWLQALRTRSQAPIVEPDVIDTGHLAITYAGEDDARVIWYDRNKRLRDQLQRLRADRESPGTDNRTWLENALQVILDVPQPITLFEELGQAEQDGESIAARLKQLNLSRPAFLYLHRIMQLLESDPAATILDTEWEDVYNILVQVRKERQYGEWREQERGRIILSPEHFKLSDPRPFTFPPETPTPRQRWRASDRDVRAWEDNLEARLEQQAATDSLGETVSAAEEETLPLLRDALIQAINPAETPLREKAQELSQRLLIDTQDSGCRLTTRVGQAIETLQDLLWSLRTGQLSPYYRDLQLKREEFDEEWRWIGSYATWRAAMFVYLYPENILLPSLRRWQTPGFKELVRETRSNRKLTPEQACAAATRYSIYLRDVANLYVGATCTAETFLRREDCVGIAERVARKPTLLHLFAQSPVSETLYWSTHTGRDSDYAQSFWQALPQFTNVAKIIGAVPYEIDDEQRYLYLFVQTQEAGEQKLIYDRFNLETGSWEKQNNELDIPEDATVFSAVVKQTVSADKPPSLAIRLEHGAIYVLSMNLEGTDWVEDDFLPIGQPDWPSSVYFFRYFFSEILAMVEIATGEFFLIARGPANRFWYRLFGDRDDGRWRKIEELDVYLNRFYGAFSHPGTESVYLVVESDLSQFYYQIQISQPLAGGSFMGLEAFDIWLRSLAGVSLAQVTIPSDRISDPRTNLLSVGLALDFLTFRNWVETLIGDLIEEDSPRGRQWKRAADMVETYTAGGLTLFQAIYRSYYRSRVIFYHRVSTSAGEWSRVNVSLLGNVQEIAPASFSGTWRRRAVMPVAYYPPRGHRVPLLMWLTAELSSDERLASSLPLRLTPLLAGPFTIPERLVGPDFSVRKDAVRTALVNNSDEPLSTRAYLEEAYYFVPVHLALQLQRQGHYLQALDWFRTVYNYGSAPDTLENRRIYPYLQQDGPLAEHYTRLTDWLLDPLNMHEIASSRPGTYTRFTLMAIVRCLLAYADAEFTQDTSESVTRARELYTTALDLLRLPDLQQLSGACQDIVAWLVNELDAAISAEAPEWRPAWEGLAISLGDVSDPDTVARLADHILEEALGDGALEERLMNARESVTTELQSTPSQQRISNLIEHDREVVELLHTALLTLPEIADATESASKATGQQVITIDGAPHDAYVFTSDESESPGPDYSPGLSFSFCVPINPILEALQLHAELNLYKIRSCRNIAGLERSLDPYAAPTDTVTGLPQIGVGGNLVLPGAVNYQPTPYRFAVLIERSKQLVQFANQTEAAMFAAIEKRDAEFYNQLTARQQVSLSRAGLRLQDLRLKEARNGIDLAELQQERSQIQFDHYNTLLDEGLSELEEASLGLMIVAAAGHAAAAIAYATSGQPTSGGSALSSLAAAASTTASLLSQWASYERRRQDWEFQRTLAQQDIRIGAQHIKLAEDRLKIVGQERKIAEIQTDHAKEIVDYLANKFTNVELYDWMSDVLEGVYSFFLQQATSVAKLAEYQLAFERQETPPAIIQADYWEAPSDSFVGIGEGNAPDRRGLTGSARLLQDIVQLDQHAFDTNRRKLELSNTISLARLAPAEFQRFRETGLMRFDTPMELFDRNFPGHYLRLIRRVRTSVVALVPPTDSIHATLTTTGLSRVVIGGNLFQTVPIRRTPESVALTSPRDATGLLELNPQPQEMLLPFESMGVDTSWELRMPKASNQFEFNTIADVLFTIEYTALDSFEYRQQVLYELDQTLQADRSFSFRQEFADQWYDLNNPHLTDSPMTVRFTTDREDFPPNLEQLRIRQVLLYFARSDGASFEIPVTHLQFTEQGATTAVGGGAASIDGVISTRRGNGSSWLAILEKRPVGEWELALTDSRELRDQFTNEEIEDILLVITYRGRTPVWPE